jgi:L-threonylcarbamoyladenylate synthase
MPQVAFSELVTGLRDGLALGSFPTDTVPALAARPDRAWAIYETKQRDPSKPLILMGACAADLWPYVADRPEATAQWQAIAQRVWPGALTLVLPASPDRPPIPQDLAAGDATIGLRVPACEVARSILAQTGPLLTTSINRSGQPPLRTIADINREFPHVLTLSPDDVAAMGDSEEGSGLPSTVVRWTPAGWDLLRQGSVQFTDSFA